MNLNLPPRLPRGLAMLLLCATLWIPRPGLAYEGPTTHAGLTAEAMMASRLHTFLRRQLGLGLGLFTRLELRGAAMDSRVHRLLQFDLEKLDPGGGYRPDDKEGQFAGSWTMAGSVLAGAPASLNRHHFLDPTEAKGLDNSRPVIGWFVSLLATLEGADTVRQFFTGTGFDLTGDPATGWLFHQHNPHSAGAFYSHLAASVAEAKPELRRHSLALSLTAMGGMLHLLQDMASPTHARNDFSRGHLERLGSSSLDRGPAYERFVASRFGQLGLPPFKGAAITRPTLRAYFHSPRWDGLADLTHLGHFSPGTLPHTIQVRTGDGVTVDPAELRERLAKDLPYQKPELGPLDLACAAKRTCYMRTKGTRSPSLAYRLGPKKKLRFRLDQRVHSAAAKRLLPLALGFSTGFINHLLRGKVELALGGADSVTMTNRGPNLVKGRLRVFSEDDKGLRTQLADHSMSNPVAAGKAFPELKVAIPKGTIKLIGLVEGVEGGSNDPLVATTIYTL